MTHPQCSRLLIRLAPILLCAAALLSLILPVLAANPGDLDPSFGNGGVVTPTIPITDFLGNAIAIQPDGKIVTAGQDPTTGGLFVVLRHNPDGSLDSSFGNGGVVTSAFSSISGGPGPVGLALQGDGKIVVVGGKAVSNTLSTLAVARYIITGSLDSAFGQGGVVTTTLGNSSKFFIGVAIQTNGKIVAAGSSSYNSSQENFTLVRYTITGTLDNTFGSNGVVTTSIPGVKSRGYGVAIQSTGKIVIGGSSGSSTFALARYTITGTLDSTFGNNGVVTTLIGSDAHGDALVIQPDDKILMVGSNGNTPTPFACPCSFALARYTSEGSLDNGFGSSGIVTTTINGYGDGNGIALQPDGKIVVVGTGKTVSNTNAFGLIRYNSNGTLDNSFGSNGTIAAPIGLGYSVAIQPDHKIAVVGDGSYASGVKYTLARYLGDNPNLTPQAYLPLILKP